MTEYSKLKKNIGYPQADLFVAGKPYRVGVIDITIKAVYLITQADLGVAVGDTLAVTMDDFPSAVVYVRSIIQDRILIEFRAEIDASVVDYVDGKWSELIEMAVDDGEFRRTRLAVESRAA
ncbi:hypothetical protein QWY75_01625 [Pontixanthobacter aestiaquae]|uniref:PilZ domain-containing protein n=1 Tax=Pontixanthobacter aestiaquae TaxID=1509367 RepID=A0A844ZEA5_9SPHN|nr:hypothetical protein [Pontixanthobacter aestiaquae]MDN3644900.1 hypothetical protein [Pontixanthobacter aestiaquae]MXO84099.1 hypothetical protein [Pontixanthobacter aestiaquae]